MLGVRFKATPLLGDQLTQFLELFLLLKYTYNLEPLITRPSWHMLTTILS